MRQLFSLAIMVVLNAHALGQTPAITVQETADEITINTDAVQAKIKKKGYVSGIAAGSFLDKKTGAKDAGFGLHIMDFLLGPGWKDDAYTREPKFHGNLPKHYIEGPQICTQAKKLDPEIIRGDDFIAVRMQFRFTQGHNGYKAGSLWQQTLVFQPKLRYVVCSESITSVNDVEHLLYRIDMPGHIKHKNLDTFEQIYLSYHGAIPAKEFAKDFAPDAKFLYQRKDDKVPSRMIRAYQMKLDDKPGAGRGHDAVPRSSPASTRLVCLSRSCMGCKVKASRLPGAAYVVGY